jgi:hypothetical protein
VPQPSGRPPSSMLAARIRDQKLVIPNDFG